LGQILLFAEMLKSVLKIAKVSSAVKWKKNEQDYQLRCKSKRIRVENSKRKTENATIR